jgi:hypothetical protein
MAQALTVKRARQIIREASGDRSQDQTVKLALEVLRKDAKDCIFQGQEAYVASLARIENPYRPGTARYIAWAEGWDAAYEADRR